MAFQEDQFRQRMDKALQKVATILENTKNPKLVEDVHHEYDDKYLLAEFLTNISIASMLNLLETLGLTVDGIKKLIEWSKNSSVSLRLSASEKCKFKEKKERKVESKTQYVTERTGVFGSSKTTEKVVTKVTDYFWDFSFEYELTAFKGSNPNDKLRLQGREGSCVIKTSSDHNPRSNIVRPGIDVNISWLFSRMNSKDQMIFKINRGASSCKTPRRNECIYDALNYFGTLSRWATRVTSYFKNDLFPAQQDHSLDLGALNSTGMFIPVLPLFEDVEAAGLPAVEDAKGKGKEDGALQIGSKVVPISYINPFLAEQLRSINEKMENLGKVFPNDKSVITVVEGSLLSTMAHANDLVQAYTQGIEYIEYLLRKQLIAAIGKEVTPADFCDYMVFHNRKLFKKEYGPKPFCHAIRRPDHYPEGILSVEMQTPSAGGNPEAIQTISSRSEAKNPMFFGLDSATKVGFKGERYVHSWVHHQFSDSTSINLNLTARARQFSCFILMLGRITGPNEFEPSHAILIQNKDDLVIPLIMEQVPAPADGGKDPLESLSPEQQRFVTMFRKMKLQQSMFAICILQIKPQLEKLLKLSNDSLTKEIKLTQDLMNLFVEYQIPPDLLSFDGPESAPVRTQIARVQHLVTEMKSMIESFRKDAIGDAAALKRMRLLQTPADIVIDFRFVSRKAPGRIGKTTISKASGTSKTTDEEVQEQEEGQDIDFTQIPIELDHKFAAFDEDHALRPTVLKTSKDNWKKTFYKSLLSKESETTLAQGDRVKEHNKAYDLLDALSRSGVLCFDDAALHIVLCATHSFDKSLLNTIVQDNVNPIEKVERSTLIIATTIHRKTLADDLVTPEEKGRVSLYSPTLFE
mmetsp:Transcript_232/g.438  ORF Transcript_232/g.438 Transcript_232/m.438 type:complete len:862 (-) Transcript_232:69-2654(-)|eukprot:CAMPEP_0201521940 /NCGR_PEP_ID=MMETSP0161_2-20130828/16361_1 /ASSEMBLY_ACC=CAM_ASM_000251 /TAXON_ID=180227 /ORGANISM="Neoparamoeba aestuarina, Strain SoJaBio B1-5/56/2" /LENGTH=861 /DNA_ID=CAMNT_0047920681 /DNA_START=144 /DNA_END=2729 /DNA_ORIENTATION=+